MIRGEFLESGGSVYPLLRVGISVPVFGSGYAPLPFVIDTGSPRSVLHPGDVRSRFGLSADQQAVVVASQTATGSAGGIGGSATYARVAATMVFVHTDGRVDMHEESVLITAPSAANLGLPSLLGMDILQHYRLTITGTQSITLESLAELGLD